MPLVADKPVRTRDINVAKFYAHVTVGSVGAPTLIAGRGLVVTRTGVGDYTVTLANTKQASEVLHASVTLNVQSDQDRTAVGKGYTGSAGARTAWSFTVLAAATPTELASGDSFTVELTVRNSGSA